MKKLLFTCMTLLSMLNVLAQTMPTLSTTEKEVWYYVQGISRTTDPEAKWLTGCAAGDPTMLTVAPLSGTNDAQLWKLVANGDGFALVNKAFGSYVNSDATSYFTDVQASIIGCVATAPTPLKLIAHTDQTTYPNGFFLVNSAAQSVVKGDPTLTFQYYQSGSATSYKPINYNGVSNANAVISFLQPRDILANQMTTVTQAMAKCSMGSSVGQFPEESVTALTNALESAQMLLEDSNSTSSALIAEYQNLKLILSLFGSTVIQPQISTGNADEYWYYIQGTRTPNTYLTAGPVGTATSVKNLAVIPDDTQLWKLVPNTQGTANGFAIVNKATGEYIDTDQPRVMATITNMPVNNLRLIPHTTYINKRLLFRIENSEGSAPALRFHFDGDSGIDLVNWTGNANITSDWLFISADEADKTLFEAAVAQARDAYDKSADKQGEQFGQYSASVRQALLTVLTVNEARDVLKMTKEDFQTSTADLRAALDAFVVNSDVTFLVSTAEKQKYFSIKVIQSGKYITDAGTDAKISQTALVKDNPAQLWCLQESTPGAVTYNLVSKLGNKVKWMADDERYVASAEAENFTVGFPSTGVVVLGRDGSGQYFNCWAGDVKGESGNTQVGEYDVFDDAFNLLDFKYVVEVNTAVASVKAPVNLKIVDRKVVLLDKAVPFKVINASGIQQDATKALVPGIYIVVVKDQAVKVNIQ